MNLERLQIETHRSMRTYLKTLVPCLGNVIYDHEDKLVHAPIPLTSFLLLLVSNALYRRVRE